MPSCWTGKLRGAERSPSRAATASPPLGVCGRSASSRSAPSHPSAPPPPRRAGLVFYGGSVGAKVRALLRDWNSGIPWARPQVPLSLAPPQGGRPFQCWAPGTTPYRRPVRPGLTRAPAGESLRWFSGQPSVGWPSTAVGYAPTAVGCMSTAVGSPNPAPNGLGPFFVGKKGKRYPIPEGRPWLALTEVRRVLKGEKKGLRNANIQRTFTGTLSAS